MRVLIGIGLLLVAVGCGGSSGGGDCAAACDIALALACPGDSLDRCLNSCEAFVATPGCESEAAAAVNCVTGLSPSDLECDGSDAETRPGRCEAEESAFQSCFLGG